MTSDHQQDKPNKDTRTPWKLVHSNKLHEETQHHVDLSNLSKFHLSTNNNLKRQIQVLDLIAWWGFVIFFLWIPFRLAIIFNKNKLTWSEFKCLMLSAQYKRKYPDSVYTSNRQ